MQLRETRFKIRSLPLAAAALVLVTSALAGCASRASTKASSGRNSRATETPCTAPRGAFQVRYQQQPGGTCGAMAERELPADARRSGPLKEPCSGEMRWSTDYCSASLESTCPAAEFGPGHTSKQYAGYRYSGDGRAWAGNLEFSAFDASGALVCRSTYQVEARAIDRNSN